MSTFPNRFRLSAAALLLLLIPLSGCQSALQNEAQRLSELLRTVPEVARISTEATEAPVGYSSRIGIRVGVDGSAPDSLLPVLDAWRAASSPWETELTIETTGGRCTMIATGTGPTADIEKIARFFDSVCTAFPTGDLWFALGSGTTRSSELHLDLTDAGVPHADAALGARIQELPGADAPVSPWFVKGADDEVATDLSTRG